MAKVNQQQRERPSPLTWMQISEDLNSANEDDVAFQIGQENERLKYVAESPGKSSPPSSPHSHASSSGDNHSEDIRASCDKVSRLLELFEKLKETPATLQEKYNHLKLLGQDMHSSIEELKTLSQNMVVKCDSQQGPGLNQSSPRQEVPSGKGKAKHRKKK